MALIDRPGGETVVCYPEVTVTDSGREHSHSR